MAKEFTSVAYGALSSTDTKLMVEAAATETLNYSKIRLQEMKKMVDDGNYSWRIGGLVRLLLESPLLADFSFVAVISELDTYC